MIQCGGETSNRSGGIYQDYFQKQWKHKIRRPGNKKGEREETKLNKYKGKRGFARQEERKGEGMGRIKSGKQK